MKFIFKLANLIWWIIAPTLYAGFSAKVSNKIYLTQIKLGRIVIALIGWWRLKLRRTPGLLALQRDE